VAAAKHGDSIAFRLLRTAYDGRQALSFCSTLTRPIYRHASKHTPLSIATIPLDAAQTYKSSVISRSKAALAFHLERIASLIDSDYCHLLVTAEPKEFQTQTPDRGVMI